MLLGKFLCTKLMCHCLELNNYRHVFTAFPYQSMTLDWKEMIIRDKREMSGKKVLLIDLISLIAGSLASLTLSPNPLGLRWWMPGCWSALSSLW
jgi:hypothetical protein